MKIVNVEANSRKRSFEVRTEDGLYHFPFAKLRLEPSKDDPVAEVFVDPELGEEAFTYRLESGREDSIHLDSVLEVAQDPEYLQELLLHRLTVEARKGLESSGLGKRQVARQLGTSPSQLYRLLDPENPRKSVGQMLALLHLVEKEVEISVRPRPSSQVPYPDRFEIYQTKSGTYHFRLKSDRGKTVLKSDPYKTRSGCIKGIRSLRSSARYGRLFKKTKTARTYGFTLKARNNRILAKSARFTSASKRDAAIDAVRKRVSSAEVETANSS